MDRVQAKAKVEAMVYSLNFYVRDVLTQMNVDFQEVDSDVGLHRCGVMVDVLSHHHDAIVARQLVLVEDMIKSYIMKRAREARGAGVVLRWLPVATHYTWRLDGSRFKVCGACGSSATLDRGTARLDVMTNDEVAQLRSQCT